MRMIRKQVYIDPRQERLLKRRASELGVTEAELIRRGLDQTLAVTTTARPADPSAWQAFMRTVRRRMRINAPQRRRAWTRDELYDRPRPRR